MEIKTLNLQIVCNVGNYESIRVGAEWSSDGDTKKEMLQIDALLRENVAAIVEARKEPKQEPQQQTQQPKKKEPLTFGHPQLKAILKRIGEGVAPEKVYEYYEPDEQVKALIELQVTTKSKITK